MQLYPWRMFPCSLTEAGAKKREEEAGQISANSRAGAPHGAVVLDQKGLACSGGGESLPLRSVDYSFCSV